MENTSIGECEVGKLVRKLETDYRSGNTTISKYVNHDMLETLNRIDAYHYSKHITGDKDSLGRDKPFPNIVVSAENIWYRATDIDRGNIKFKAKKKKDVINAFLKTIHLQNWMRKENFGVFLNDWGRALSRYGSAVVKFVEVDGELHRYVVPWQTLIVDSVDFENNPVIEVLDLTEAQLYQRKGYDKELVEKLCDAKTSRKTAEGTNKDNKNDYIRVYEIHGMLPLSYLTGKDGDDDTFVQQMHVISFVESKEAGKYDDYTLYSGQEEKNPYMITHLIREEGRTLSIGPVEYLFDTQWMICHTAKAIKDQLDLATKLIFQTSDSTFVAMNAMTAIETGDILIHKPNEPITQVANNSHDITPTQNFANWFKSIGIESVGVSEAMLGKAAVSGTAWRQVEALLNESHDLFDQMIENKGLHIEDMMRKYVLPFINKKMDTTEEIAATLQMNDIDMIDSMYIKTKSVKEANKIIKARMKRGKPTTPEEQAMIIDTLKQNMKSNFGSLGNQRFFSPSEIPTKTWKELFKDSDDDIEVDVTGESVDKDAMTTLNSVLAFFVRKNGQPLTSEERFTINKILMQSGTVSPIEISSLNSNSSQAQPNPTQ